MSLTHRNSDRPGQYVWMWVKELSRDSPEFLDLPTYRFIIGVMFVVSKPIPIASKQATLLTLAVAFLFNTFVYCRLHLATWSPPFGAR